MNETMRDYLKRRQRRYRVAFILGLVLVLVPIALANIVAHDELRQHRELFLVVRLTGLAVLGIGASVLSSRIRCPKCNKSLGASGRGLPAFCPNCGVNFDEPMPQNPISPIS